MKRNLPYLFFLTVSLFSVNAFSQSNTRGTAIAPNPEPETTGNTYAIIIGISSYQNINKLQYADKDAKAFYDFLRSKSGGNVDSSNINLMLNSQARRANMTRALSKWLMQDKKPQKGDKVFIYFAGHGDAIPGVSSFLLGWDVPNTGDPNVDYDDNGGIMIEELKRRIKIISDNGAKVILITDACRGSEVLSGGEKGQDNVSKDLLANDMEQKSGGLQFASCSTGEVSREDKVWGGGRGLFSFWLINGLYGMADKDGDGVITAGNLSAYVKDKVKEATKRKDVNGEIHYDQKPFFCCDENGDEIVAKVDLEKKKVIENELSQQGGEGEMLPSKAVRGLNNDVILNLPDTLKILYNSFENKIQNDTSLSYDWKEYMNAYSKMIQYPITDKFSSTIKDELLIALFNHSQQAMNFYLESKKIISDSGYRTYFSNAVLCLKAAQELVDKNDELYTRIKRNILILDVVKSIHSSSDAKVESKYISQKVIDAAFKNLDMAKALMDAKKKSAVLYHTYALLYQYECNYRKAMENDSLAVSIAPRWIYALSNLGTLNEYLSQYDKAEKYFRNSLKFDSSYAYSLLGLAKFYTRENKNEEAETYYLRALHSDTTNIDLLQSVEHFYKTKKEYDKMDRYYTMEGKVNPVAFKTLGDFYNAQLKQYDKAENYYYRYWKSDTADMKALMNIANYCYRRKEYDKAAMYCLKAVILDSKNADAFTELGNIYTNLQRYDRAELFFLDALQIDKGLCNALSGLGLVYKNQKQYDKAEEYYLRALKTNPTFAEISFQLACCYALQKDDKMAIKYLKKSMDDGYLDYNNIQTDSDFDTIRNSPDFKALMK